VEQVSLLGLLELRFLDGHWEPEKVPIESLPFKRRLSKDVISFVLKNYCDRTLYLLINRDISIPIVAFSPFEMGIDDATDIYLDEVSSFAKRTQSKKTIESERAKEVMDKLR